MLLHDVMWQLSEVFTKESIMKIYGGDEDELLALQRDFGIYVVNLFSLRHGARVLSLKKTDVPSLLEQFCGLKYKLLSQRCDWR